MYNSEHLHLVDLPRQIAIFALCSAFGQAETQTQEFSHVILQIFNFTLRVFFADVEDPAGLHFPDDCVVWPRHQRKDHHGSNGAQVI